MASTDLPRVLRIPRIGGGEQDFVLLHVSSTGRHLHDLKLIGTDGDEVYSVKVKHNQTSTLTTKNFPGTEAQWEETLSVILLGADATEFTIGVEAVAKVKSDKTSITITIQKSIEGIKQNYGAITLAHTEDEEISLLNWCALTIQSKENLSMGLADLKATLRGKDEEIKRLNEKLAELVTLKKAYDDDLVQKFFILLNEKKLKIRDQQRLLATATVDPTKLDEVERNRIPERDSHPRPSGTRKRKAPTVLKDENDDDTDEGFEKMDVDTNDVEAERISAAEEDERQTEDEQSTADEDSEDEPPPVKLPTRSADNANASTSRTEDEDAVIPPKRDLPFSKKPAAPTAKAATPVVEGSETESDDEL